MLMIKQRKEWRGKRRRRRRLLFTIPSASIDLARRFVPEIQERYVEAWKELDPKAQVSSQRTIEDALDPAREIGDQSNGTQVLIMGSLHLVSGALYLLEPDNII